MCKIVEVNAGTEYESILKAVEAQAKNIGEIVPSLDLPRSNVSYYIEKLYEMGLVSRTYYKKQTIISITDTGRTFLEQMQAADTIFIVRKK